MAVGDICAILVLVEPPSAFLNTSSIVATTRKMVGGVSLVVLHDEGRMMIWDLSGLLDPVVGDVDVLDHVIE